MASHAARPNASQAPRASTLGAASHGAHAGLHAATPASGASHDAPGAHNGHGGGAAHGHTIVPLATLRLVLLALLFFTLLTVGVSKGEAIVADLFSFEIPQWVNVVIALSIAAVKTAIVVLFFMQLKYDNPLNGMIFIFTIITVAFFLGFTMIDLGGRQTLDRFKGEYISPGGTGLISASLGNRQSFSGPITLYARTKAELEGKHLHSHEHEELRAGFTDAGYRAPEPGIGSSSRRSRPVIGLTLPGFAPAKAKDDHGDDHDAAH